MTWEDDYKLSVLRAAGVDTARIVNVDITTFNLTIHASDGSNIGGGCDTCGYGESNPSFTIRVEWMEKNNKGKYMRQIYVTYDMEDSAAFIRRVLAP